MRLLYIPALATILAAGWLESAAADTAHQAPSSWVGRCIGVEDAFRSSTVHEAGAIRYPEGRPDGAKSIMHDGFGLPWSCNDSDNAVVSMINTSGDKTLFRIRDERDRDRPVMVLMQSSDVAAVKAAIDADKADYARSIALSRQWEGERAELNVINGIVRPIMVGMKGSVVPPPGTLNLISDRLTAPSLDGYKASGYYAILSSNGFFTTTAISGGDKMSASMFWIAPPYLGFLSPELHVSDIPGHPDKTLFYVTNNTETSPADKEVTDDNPAVIDSVYFQTCGIYLGHGKCAIWGMIVPTADVPAVLPNLKLQMVYLVRGGIKAKAEMDAEDAANKAKAVQADMATRNAVAEAKSISKKTGY